MKCENTHTFIIQSKISKQIPKLLFSIYILIKIYTSMFSSILTQSIINKQLKF